MRVQRGDAQRPRITNQHAEHAASAWSLADRPFRLDVQAARDEPFKLGARLVEHAQRCVARSGQLARRVEHTREHSVELELGDDETTNIDQGAQAIRFKLI
jgi:hypothetical protein